MDRNVSIYQTNGLCSDFCRAEYAWSVTQDESCWCSNYTPDEDTQVDLKKCDIKCPAFPDEYCGGRGGLFGYVELKMQAPSGTKGPDDSKTTTDDDPSSTSMVQTLTTDGTIKTVTVLPTGSDGADGSDGGADGRSGNGMGAGPIAGIVIGVVGAIAIVAGIAFFFFRRRKRNQADGYKGDPSVRGNSSDRMGSAHPEMTMGGGTSPNSAAMGGSNRNSTLAIDPRMDPFKQGLYGRNGSRESVGSLRDDHDYSRRILRATNPDPNDD